MKRVLLMAGLMAAFMLVIISASAQNKTSFAGTWSLDKAKSEGLSARMAGADKVTWTITQDDKTISIDSKVEGGQAGGGGGMGGGRGPSGPQSYNLDGNEVTSDANFGPAAGKVTTKASWLTGGQGLELSRKFAFQGPDGSPVNSTSTQKLSVSGDGKVLTVVQHSEGPRGVQDSTMVFNKG